MTYLPRKTKPVEDPPKEVEAPSTESDKPKHPFLKTISMMKFKVDQDAIDAAIYGDKHQFEQKFGGIPIRGT